MIRVVHTDEGQPRYQQIDNKGNIVFAREATPAEAMQAEMNFWLQELVIEMRIARGAQ